MKIEPCPICAEFGPRSDCGICNGRARIMETSDTDRNDIPDWMRDTLPAPVPSMRPELPTLPDTPRNRTPTLPPEAA